MKWFGKVGTHNGRSATDREQTLEVRLAAVRHRQKIRHWLLQATCVIGGRDDQRRAGEDHEARAGLRGRLLERALLELDAASDEGAAEDEKYVRKNTSEHGSLDDAELSLDESDDSNDRFDRVCAR